jgi:hypothetical protein
MIIFLSLGVCLIGLIVYALSNHPKVSELARIAYFAGLLAFLLQVAPRMMSILGSR